MGFKNWETPPDFFKALNDEFHFTLDAAASHENALLPRYFTETGFTNKDRFKDCQILDQVDGLTWSWQNERIFCNPPYDSSLHQWVEKAAKREAEVAVLLLPPSVDTRWFHEFCWPSNFYWERQNVLHGGEVWDEVGDYMQSIAFMHGRLKFWHPALQPGTKIKDELFNYSKPHVPGPAPRAGNMLAIFRRMNGTS